MLDDLVGAYGSRLFLAAGGVGIALLCLIAVLWLMRRRTPSPFVRGGKSRQPRLQVLDAAAVDARRRLVLVRRDDVEHLIMIGGPTDVVIESRISDTAPIASGTSRGAIDAEMAAAPPPRPEPQAVARASTPADRVPELMEPHAPAVPVQERRQRPELASRPDPDDAASLSTGAEREPTTRGPEPASPAQAQTIQAANVLDAARQRVLPPQPERPQPRMAPPVQSLSPAAQQVAPAAPPESARAPAAPPREPQPKEPGGDFQSILEAEMSSNLAAERIVPAPNPTAQRSPQSGPMPRRDPEMAPMTGSDAALQKEVARIFGEMSVNRDK